LLRRIDPRAGLCDEDLAAARDWASTTFAPEGQCAGLGAALADDAITIGVGPIAQLVREEGRRARGVDLGCGEQRPGVSTDWVCSNATVVSRQWPSDGRSWTAVRPGRAALCRLRITPGGGGAQGAIDLVGGTREGMSDPADRFLAGDGEQRERP